jgi:hypothetical protein
VLKPTMERLRNNVSCLTFGILIQVTGPDSRVR